MLLIFSALVGIHIYFILRLCNTYFFSTATMVARTRLSVTLYVHLNLHFKCNLIDNIKKYIGQFVVSSTSLVENVSVLCDCVFNNVRLVNN